MGVSIWLARKHNALGHFRRGMSLTQKDTNRITNQAADGLVLGLYEGGELTRTAKQLDKQLAGRITQQLALSQAKGKPSEIRVLYGLCERWPRLAVVGLGNSSRSEEERRDSSRKAVSSSESLMIARVP
jgi:hypothetical protein